MPRSSIPQFEDKHRRLLEDCFRREAGSAVQIPGDDVDLVDAGILDSMGWVSFLRAVETASGAPDLASNLNERSASFAVLLKALRDSKSIPNVTRSPASRQGLAHSPTPTVIAASSSTVGSRVISSEEVDRAFGLPVGKLRKRAGIESLAYVAEDENELTLAAKAAQEALRAASCGPQEVDWIIATSETHHDYPSLSRAAITRMEKVITSVELRSGIPRGCVGGFATHQPNPRLVALLAKQCGVSPSTFPPIARVSGNLGSSTCGAALHEALRNAEKQSRDDRRPIFLASLGPGLLFGGGWLTPHENGK